MQNCECLNTNTVFAQALHIIYMHMSCSDESYHVRNMVRVHLIQELIIDIGIGKIKAEVKKSMLQSTYFPVFCMKSLKWGEWTDPSTRSPMFSRWPRNVLQWYWWPESISDVFWTQTSANVCCKHRHDAHMSLHHKTSLKWHWDLCIIWKLNK